MDWNTHFADMLGEATELMHSGNLMEATAAIQRALNNQAPMANAAPAARAAAPHPASPSASTHAKLNASVEDAVVRESPDSFERVNFIHAGVRHQYRNGTYLALRSCPCSATSRRASSRGTFSHG